MGAEATCERLDGAANGIGRGTPSSALLGRLRLSEGACTAGQSACSTYAALVVAGNRPPLRAEEQKQLRSHVHTSVRRRDLRYRD